MKFAVIAPLLIAALSSSAFADDLSDSMMRAGLDPDALVASGVVAAEIAGVVEDVVDHLAANASAIADADASYLAATSEISRLTKLVRSGKASAQDIADLATEKSNQADAEVDRDAALAAIFNAGTSGLSASETSALSKIRGNRHWSTEIEFTVKDRSDQDWLNLVEALTDERISQDEGATASAACSALLASERSDTDVAASKVAYDTNASAVQVGWTSPGRRGSAQPGC